MSKEIYSNGQKLIAERLKKARLDAGLDQSKVAEILGKTQSYVSKIEAGQRKISIVQLKEFAAIYKKNLDFFIQ